MWLQTIALTLLFFVAATGFGLFILALASTALIRRICPLRTQLLALGFIVGAPAAGIFLQLLSVSTTDLRIDFAAIVIASSLGLLLTRSLWRPRIGDLKQIAMWVALSVPLALLTWWCSFGVLSKFPFTDLGADVHWMKIAREFADTGALNPYVNQTYTDIRSTLVGLFAGVLGLDLLQFNWIYRYFSILYLLVLFFAIADSIFVDHYRKWFAFFFAGATNTLGLLTNGSLALAGSFIFLGVLIRSGPRSSPERMLSWSTLSPASGAVLAISIAYVVNNNALMLGVLSTILLASNILNRTGYLEHQSSINTLVGVVWSSALIFLHRGSYLFVPIAVAGWLFYLLALKMASSPSLRVFRAAWIIALLLPAVGVFILACIIAARLGYLPQLNANALFSHVTVLFFGIPIDPGGEVSLGAGPEVAAIEVARALGPVFALYVGLAFAWWWITNSPSRLSRLANDQKQRENVARLLWSWIAACGLCLAVLSGFPFLYRLIFVISCYFTIVTTELFAQLCIDPLPDPERRRRKAAIATLAIAILAAGLYSVDWISRQPHGGYPAMLWPVEIAGVILVLLLAGLVQDRSRRRQIVGLAAAISLTVAIDRSGIAMLFRVYSYGHLPDRATVVSHYDSSDLKVTDWLHQNVRHAVVVSDPYTLGMARAMAGVPGLYLFSNLDTVNEATARRIKNGISAMLGLSESQSDRRSRTCAAIAPLLSNLNSEALFQMGRLALTQGMLRSIRITPPPPSHSEPSKQPDSETIAAASEILRTPQGEWNVVAIINPRTVQWLHLSDRERLPYFPIDRSLDLDIVRRIEAGPFPVLFSDGQNVAILIRCTKG